MAKDDFLTPLREGLQAELKAMAAGARVSFQNIKPPPAKVDVAAKVQQFLSASPEQLQQIAMQLGPEGYKQFIDKNISDAHRIGAGDPELLYQYYGNPENTQQQDNLPTMDAGLEQELLSLIGQ